jgi:prepilin-type N-terminal cleavage/methylation domain-containing protein
MSVQHLDRPHDRTHGSPGFTLVEMLVVCAIMAVIAMCVVPTLSDARMATRISAAEKLQKDLTNTFNQWTALGGRFNVGSDGGPTGSHAAQLLYVLSQPAGIPLCIQNPPNWGGMSDYRLVDSWVDEGTAELAPSPSTIRIALVGNFGAAFYLNHNIDDSEGVIYDGQYRIKFTPTNVGGGGYTSSGTYCNAGWATTGTWSVTPYP